MLKVSPRKGVIRFKKRRKLNPQYIGPFKILKRVSPVVYKLELPEELNNVHSTFYVSNLKKWLSNESLINPMKELRINDKLNFVEEPIEIMDREVKQPKQSRIPIVKVQRIKNEAKTVEVQCFSVSVSCLGEVLGSDDEWGAAKLMVMGDDDLELGAGGEDRSSELFFGSGNPLDDLHCRDCFLRTLRIIMIVIYLRDFSNPLFDLNDDFTSSDDESLSVEDVPEDNNIESKDSYVSNFNEPTLLVTHLSDANDDECFDRGSDVDEIELLLHHDPSTPKISVASILEGFTDEPPLEENDDLFDLESKENEWKKILYDAPIDDLMTEDNVFDPGILEKFCSPTYVSLPFEDRHYLSLTYVIRIFLPYLTYYKDSSLILSFESEDTILDPDIFVFSYYSLEPVVSHRSGTFMCASMFI
ncbi:hypothetical protein Tco_0786746 [Tanacetum coccineum]